MSIRSEIIRVAHTVDSLRAAIPEQLPEFRDLLGPPPVGAQWDLARAFSCRKVNGRYVTTGVSSCGLVAAGILRRAGVRLPWNGSPYWQAPAPYRGLDIVSELSLLGLNTGSRRAGKPVPGDVVCIGAGLATHVFTVTSVSGSCIESVDGGQVDDAAHGYLQRVKVCQRAWPRPLVWCIDVDRLHNALEGTSPIVQPWTVEDTQRALRAHGYSLTVDGIAGPMTKAAILDFQRSHGLVADGVVGPATRAAMQVG